MRTDNRWIHLKALFPSWNITNPKRIKNLFPTKNHQPLIVNTLCFPTPKTPSANGAAARASSTWLQEWNHRQVKSRPPLKNQTVRSNHSTLLLPLFVHPRHCCKSETITSQIEPLQNRIDYGLFCNIMATVVKFTDTNLIQYYNIMIFFVMFIEMVVFHVNWIC